MVENERKGRTVIHLEIGGEHHYFGSIASIFDCFEPKDIGVAYGTLKNYGLSPENPYKNKRCIIRRGFLLTKKGGRGKKRE